MARIQQVLDLYKEMGNMAAVGRELGISRQRVHQMIDKFEDGGGFAVQYTERINWKLLNKLREEARISYSEIAEASETNVGTCRHVFNGREAYISNKRRNSNHSAVRIANTMFKLIDERLRNLSKLVDQVGEDLYKATKKEMATPKV